MRVSTRVGATNLLFATSATDRLRRGRMPTNALLAAQSGRLIDTRRSIAAEAKEVRPKRLRRGAQRARSR
jgi:hypothetical protein